MSESRRVAALLATCEVVATAPLEAADDERLAEEVLALRRACDLLELRFARAAAELATREYLTQPEGEGPLHWIRHECHMTGYAAATALAVGEEAAALPVSVQAMRRGEIGYGHLALMARTSAAIRLSLERRGQTVPEHTTPLDEPALLRKARRHTVNRFRRECTHLRHAMDRDEVLREHVELVEARTLDIAPRDDGCVELHGFLDPEGGAALRTALAPLAARTGRDDDRCLERRNADALVELALRSLDAGELPRTGGTRPHLTVTTTLETLTGAEGAPGGELEFAPAVPGAMVQRLACDASITRVVFGTDSQVIEVGRALRVPSPAARRALQARDGGCAWPGCTRGVTRTHAHHLVHWARGGSTDLDNLVLLCHRHHWKVHEGGWQLVRRDGEVLAISPVHEHRTARGRDGRDESTAHACERSPALSP